MADNYPLGAEYDPRAPFNQSPPEEVIVEVGIELGTFVHVFVSSEDEIEEAVDKEVRDKFDVGDYEINRITIYQHDFPSKQE